MAMFWGLAFPLVDVELERRGLSLHERYMAMLSGLGGAKSYKEGQRGSSLPTSQAKLLDLDYASWQY